MRGHISGLFVYDVKTPYGHIKGYDGNQYYFNRDCLAGNTSWDNLQENDVVEFKPVPTSAKYPMAKFVLFIEAASAVAKVHAVHKPGFSNKLDMDKEEQIHLKPGMNERQVIEKLAKVLNISRVGHHDMGHNSRYEFCLSGVTDLLTQYVRENGEFLILFSCFANDSIQQKALNVERELRKRRDIADRRPLVNFYLIISNANDLFDKIDAEKGKAHAAAIPFTVEEILSCAGKAALSKLILARFAEYYFEINLLAEINAIETDELLFGERGKIADAIVARCQAKNHSGIFGLRRSGKSSVLLGVTRRLEWAGIPYVKIESRDYETYQQWTDALFDIARKVRAKTLGIEQREDENRQEFNRRLNLSGTRDEYACYPVTSFVEDIQHYIGDSLFVIAIDEIETITFNSATSAAWKDLTAYKGFWTALRDCGCPLVICGVNPTINEESILTFDDDECDNPMRGRIINCTESAKTYLPPFTDEQTKSMINTLGGYSNIGFSNVYAQINAAFGGQPWAIRQFCSFIFERVKDKRVDNRVYEVSKPTYVNCLREFQNSEDSKRMCRTILQHVRIYPEEYSLLVRLALSPEKTSVISPSETALVDHLLKYGLIERDSDTNYVTFCIGIVQDYIRQVEEKRPEDMNNIERRHYVQDKVAICERKLKTYVRDMFRKNSIDETDAYTTALAYLKKTRGFRPHKGVDITQCNLDDIFDHKKFDFFFSLLKTIILDHWSWTESDFICAGISKNKFAACMGDLNAGRSDADHYDAENTNIPNDWEIDDYTLSSFRVAYLAMGNFFQNQNL